ncbi:MAG: uracil-DNA glycosylase [Sulfurimonas sp.]|nr:MAG: uracil-DNA glycosylase [Sulfurimonas sp.]
MQTLNCKRCRHYFVTWQNNQPHGCRAYGFRSLQIPSVVVQHSSGMPCSLFRLKEHASK